MEFSESRSEKLTYAESFLYDMEYRWSCAIGWKNCSRRWAYPLMREGTAGDVPDFLPRAWDHSDRSPASALGASASAVGGASGARHLGDAETAWDALVGTAEAPLRRRNALDLRSYLVLNSLATAAACRAVDCAFRFLGNGERSSYAAGAAPAAFSAEEELHEVAHGEKDVEAHAAEGAQPVAALAARLLLGRIWPSSCS